MTASTIPHAIPLPEAVADEPPRRWWSLPATTYAAAGLVLVWFALQLARYVGEAPDLDGMVSLRGSLTLYNEGFHGLIASSDGTGIHPPVMDFLNYIAFAVFGAGPGAQQLLSIALFAFLAGAVERLLAPWLPARQRILAAVAVAICPSLALSLYFVSREGLIMCILVPALILALAPGGVGRRPLALGLVLALLPLTKETGLALVLPFAVDAALVGGGARRERGRRVAYVLGIPVAAALAWRIVLSLAGGSAWHTWVLSTHASDGPYVVAVRGMLGLERAVFFRENLANAFVVNYLWLPAALAVATLVLLARGRASAALQRPAALVAGLAAVYAWTTLTFPTYAEPRYAAPLTMLTILFVCLGLPLWPRRARPVVLGALIVAFAAGAWSPTDPVSRAIYGTTSVGGEQVYDTDALWRGPDRVDVNFSLLNASRRINSRLRRVYATDVTLVTGDCDAMKFGEKLYSVGYTPSAYDHGIPGARPLKCVPVKDLPAGAATGKDKIALVRTPEEDASDQPPAISGPSIVVIH
jgi:hypothetical protein